MGPFLKRLQPTIMKLSFPLSSSNNNSPKPSNSTTTSPSNHHNESPNKEFITEFDPSKTLTNFTSTNPITIPPIPNEWNPQNQSTTLNPNIQSQVSNLQSTSSIDRLMLLKLKSDLQRLPEDRGPEEFDGVPVEDFGRAYLKGYGWCEGRGIGKNTKEDVKVVDFRRRAAGEGLGFVRIAGDGGDRKAVRLKTCVNNGGKRVEGMNVDSKVLN